VAIRAGIGERVTVGEAVLEVHYRDDRTLAAALPVLRAAVAVGDESPSVPALVLEEIG
jgi:thymidine phosphorylase